MGLQMAWILHYFQCINVRYFHILDQGAMYEYSEAQANYLITRILINETHSTRWKCIDKHYQTGSQSRWSDTCCYRTANASLTSCSWKDISILNPRNHHTASCWIVSKQTLLPWAVLLLGSQYHYGQVLKNRTGGKSLPAQKHIFSYCGLTFLASHS